MLLEPIMQLEIVVPEKYSPNVNADLTRRRTEVQHVDTRGDNKASINSVFISYYVNMIKNDFFFIINIIFVS